MSINRISNAPVQVGDRLCPTGKFFAREIAGEVPTIPTGSYVMIGRAYSPHGIQQVDYSMDEGATWPEATLMYPGANQPYMVTGFSFPWDAAAGTHFIMTRATDIQGNVQPETVPLNLLGILCNAIPRFEINVV